MDRGLRFLLRVLRWGVLCEMDLYRGPVGNVWKGIGVAYNTFWLD
jgi:hypothetical protein